MALFLVRYGETGLKGTPVRSRFELMLSENIVRAHSNARTSCLVERERGRLFVSSDDAIVTGGILSRTYGVVSFSRAEECSSRQEEVASVVVARLSNRNLSGKSFAIRARRAGTHTYTSMQLAAMIGEKVLEKFKDANLRVDLTAPDIEVFVEVRNNKAYVFDEVEKGPGGLPLRTQGKVLAVIEDEKSLLAAWLMMRRGCSAVLLKGEGAKADEIERLRQWNPWWNGFLENMTTDNALKLKRCSGLVLGWDLDQFKTREKMVVDVPVFYPLVGMTSDEIDRRMKEIFA